MSTRGNICIKVREKDFNKVSEKLKKEVSDKTPYIYIYNHFDSYEEGLGKTLNEYYNSYEEVLDLVLAGDCSYPGAPYTKYGEDYESVCPLVVNKFSEAFQNEYLYLYEDGWKSFKLNDFK